MAMRVKNKICEGFKRRQWHGLCHLLWTPRERCIPRIQKPRKPKCKSLAGVINSFFKGSRTRAARIYPGGYKEGSRGRLARPGYYLQTSGLLIHCSIPRSVDQWLFSLVAARHGRRPSIWGVFEVGPGVQRTEEGVRLFRVIEVIRWCDQLFFLRVPAPVLPEYIQEAIRKNLEEDWQGLGITYKPQASWFTVLSRDRLINDYFHWWRHVTEDGQVYEVFLKWGLGSNELKKASACLKSSKWVDGVINSFLRVPAPVLPEYVQKAIRRDLEEDWQGLGITYKPQAPWFQCSISRSGDQWSLSLVAARQGRRTSIRSIFEVGPEIRRFEEGVRRIQGIEVRRWQ